MLFLLLYLFLLLFRFAFFQTTAFIATLMKRFTALGFMPFTGYTPPNFYITYFRQ
jgi:hypothetical protein